MTDDELGMAASPQSPNENGSTNQSRASSVLVSSASTHGGTASVVKQQPKKPLLHVRPHDLPATAHDLAAIIARSGRVYERAGPVKITTSDTSLPQVQPLTVDRVVIEAHELARPVASLRPVTLPERAAKLYLALDDWGLARISHTG
jgi:hypothetical protein